jgi:hypothetical protein
MWAVNVQADSCRIEKSSNVKALMTSFLFRVFCIRKSAEDWLGQPVSSTPPPPRGALKNAMWLMCTGVRAA